MQTPKSCVLVIEDEADVRDLIVLHLKREGFSVVAVDDGEKGVRALDSDPTIDLAVVDWMLPGMSGLDVTKWLREKKKTVLPVLMVTARADSADIVRGLESGADDYVTKPFEIPVFLARVRSLLRRSRAPAPQDETPASNKIRIGELELDGHSYDVTVGKEKLSLTPSEFKLLKALMENQGRVLSRDRLIELVQGEGVSVVDRAIDTHVFGLRKKLGSAADFVETIRGVGYRMKSAE
ncbi:MAG: response regulator transcription factor [Cryobacterium sp.]|nr:response regulator transcription factor [Oligoflexia bacterium]